MTLLDCTLRDGGYYNEWDFAHDLIERYVRGIAAAGIDVVEMGFRMLDPGRFLGPTAFTDDRFLARLDIPASLLVAVMVDAKVLLSTGDATAVVRELFAPKAESRVSLVRIASGYGESLELEPALALLKELGYEVAVNLMQVSLRSAEELEDFGKRCAEWRVDVAYVADSFGGMRPSEVPATIATLRAAFGGPVGCHFHDNMSYALANSMAALDAGATWVDGTIRGMGRGPGNAKTESLVLELNQRGLGNYDLLALVELVQDGFADLQREHGWGSNLFYFLSGTYGVHPTYVMELLKDGRYSSFEIVHALQGLRDEGGTRYGRDQLTSVVSGSNRSYPGSFDVTGWAEGKDILLVGPGEQGHEKRADVEEFVRKYRPKTIGINAHAPLASELIDAVAVCHPIMAVMDAHALRELGRPIFAPREFLHSLGIDPDNVLDVGFSVVPGKLETGTTAVVIPQLLVAPYALAIAASSGARRVLLTGFDGFEPNDPRYGEMVEVFKLFSDLPDGPEIVALTPNTYPIPKTSLYAPWT
ncbi:MAG TPA: aldolase catalytic domain-containing protein [Gaiellaceae bacterium]|nr:aldolase catalytic domain-containing protein [Gaiellaceae bacterium]